MKMSSRCLHDKGIAAARTVVDPHALRLQVSLDGFHAVLPTQAGSLIATKWHAETDGAVGIDPDRAGANAFCHRRCALKRLRPHAGAQTVSDVVGNFHRLLFILKFDDGDRKAKHLFLGDTHPIVDAREDRGLNEVFAATILLAGGATAEDAGGALALGDVDIR